MMGGEISAEQLAQALACGQRGCPCGLTARRGKGLTHCRARHLRPAYFTRLALRSAKVRRQRAARRNGQGGAK